jgi:hypothetical protein
MGLGRKIAVGAVAGLAGAQAMQWFRARWNAAHAVESGVFGLDREADVKSVQKLSRMCCGRDIEEDRAERIALAFHYLYGAAAGSVYAVLADRVPRVRTGFGTVFGAVIWLFGDEIPIAALRVSDPRKKTAASHASALAVHLLFGAVTEGTRLAAASRFEAGFKP